MVRKHDPDAVHLRVRVEGTLRRRLEQAAKRNNRSVNAEIVAAVERWFEKDDDVRKLIAQTEVLKARGAKQDLALEKIGAELERLQEFLNRYAPEQLERRLQLARLQLALEDHREEVARALDELGAPKKSAKEG
jgi:hypothetical protein